MTNRPKLAHVVFQTNQLEAMRDWYCTVLNAQVVHESGPLSFITFDDEHHRIAFLARPEQLDAKSPTMPGVHHVAFTFDSLDALLERFTTLEAQGISPKVPIQHGVTTSLYYQDPDGNFVEMQIDNFATPQEATNYMEGPEYGADNVGVGFKPALMQQARADGATVETLTTRAWALETAPDLLSPLAALMS
jgi:catechol-2,3-dioxygenase